MEKEIKRWDIGGLMKKSKRSKACDISNKVREQVLSRDARRCIICGSTYNLELAHVFLSRAHLGLGVKENLATLCKKHHMTLDSGKKQEQHNIRLAVESYMRSKHGDIDIKSLKYNKWSWLNE